MHSNIKQTLNRKVEIAYTIQGCALAAAGSPWRQTFVAERQEDLEILYWAP